MNEQNGQDRTDAQQIRLKVKHELAGKSRKESEPLYHAYVRLLSQDEFRDRVESTTGGRWLMRARRAVELLNWMAIAMAIVGSLACCVLALSRGPTMLWGVWVLVGIWLALNKLEVELNIRAVARGLHVGQLQSRASATHILVGL